MSMNFSRDTLTRHNTKLISFLTHPIQLNDTNNSIPEDPTNKPTPNIPFEQENYKQSQYNKVSAIKKKTHQPMRKIQIPYLFCIIL